MLQPLWPARRRVDGGPPQRLFAGLYGWYGVCRRPLCAAVTPSRRRSRRSAATKRRSIRASAPPGFFHCANWGADQLGVGDAISTTVAQPESADGRVVLSSDARVRSGSGARWMEVDPKRDRQRISLSTKRLAEDRWERFARDVPGGQTLETTITRIMPHRTFAKVAESVKRMVHVSELAGGRVADPERDPPCGGDPAGEDPGRPRLASSGTSTHVCSNV